MSYSLTDAGEKEMQVELKALEELCEEADQLAGKANDCATLAPITKRLLDAANYFAEIEYREAHGGGTCGHATVKPKGDNGTGYCGVCSFLKAEAHKYSGKVVRL